MYGRSGLDRFKKAQSLEPFSVSTVNSSPEAAAQAYTRALLTVNPSNDSKHSQLHTVPQKPTSDSVASSTAPSTALATQVGGGQSTWKPPHWAIDPRPGVYYLEVLKDGEIIDKINLDKRRHIFGRQVQTCDFVLDHQSVSRQHAAVVPHKNGSIYVIDLGSAHGTFVANERLTKETPVELEVGQSLRFAASTRIYILKKDNSALFPPVPLHMEIKLPPPPDPLDEEAVVAYNTVLNRYGLGKHDISKLRGEENNAAIVGGLAAVVSSSEKNGRGEGIAVERATKRAKKMRVVFKDEVGGVLVEVVGMSDGADVETEPGPVGVKEGGSLVGKYESLVQVTVIPKSQEQLSSVKEDKAPLNGITDKLKQVFEKVKGPPKTAVSDDLYGELFPGKPSLSWARSSLQSSISSGDQQNAGETSLAVKKEHATEQLDDDNDDLFGD